MQPSLRQKNIDSDVVTSWTEYIEESREDTDITDNVKYQTVKDGFDLYFDTHARVNKAYD